MENQMITVKNHQQSIPLTMKRMAIYKRSRIVEATDDNEQTYLLFFHLDRYLTYAKTQKKHTNSHIGNAFQSGLTVSFPHPLIDWQITSSTYKKYKFNELFKNLQREYGPQETALIATYFESLIPKEKLANLIEKLCYKERRDGKLLSCYRLYTILKSFSPNHRLVEAFSTDLSFTKYDEQYKHQDENMLAKDPIYIENHLYDQKYSAFDQLSALYRQQARWVDLIAITIAQAAYTKNENDYKKLLTMLHHHFPDVPITEILKDLYTRNLTIASFLQDLINAYLAIGEWENALHLQNQHDLSLTSAQIQSLEAITNKTEMNFDAISPFELQQLIRTIAKVNPTQASKMLHQAICALLEKHKLTYIQNWLSPFNDLPLAQLDIQKIKEMIHIFEEPNQQRRLGELYHYYHQPERAIECMSWDMELYEDDPKPVEWLAKLYSELGMEAEHKAYQQLYVDMVKRSS
ncbi:hypothetical protein M948_04505 [Virgibacillus sp. CM-4]|uniref:hypothetical protein n=1 Tax=Virgibacillus sp. CM-4 TaxID=1354277 RepID=UPI0003884141|nr:hypothetical protein [Virgibacillus sp. CM-4]EQB37830.1 hypothetical protein M948_04505 [Virgibacillus sp. CM-4]